ncbi:MAG: radical SAM protein [Clostridia bacterium]|nr:radical SAM protein [Clostridia bacterium]
MQTGFCAVGTRPLVARAAPHFYEEPCLSGTQGSGTVFFAGCSLRCVFCQNSQISRGGKIGTPVSPTQLRQLFLRLVDLGVHNINLVTPGHVIPAIAEALEQPLPVPVVYNSGGYDSVEALRLLEGKVDIYLPDFKYSDNELAQRWSAAPRYVETARSALAEMFRQVGPVQMENGLLKRGVMVRHLMLPGTLQNTYGVIGLVAELLPAKDILFSLMRQYTPPHDPLPWPQLNRRVTKTEAEAAEAYLREKGLIYGYVQGAEAAREGFVPPFGPIELP